jgi:hypothetical protein
VVREPAVLLVAFAKAQERAAVLSVVFATAKCSGGAVVAEDLGGLRPLVQERRRSRQNGSVRRAVVRAHRVPSVFSAREPGRVGTSNVLFVTEKCSRSARVVTALARSNASQCAFWHGFNANEAVRGLGLRAGDVRLPQIDGFEVVPLSDSQIH